MKKLFTYLIILGCLGLAFYVCSDDSDPIALLTPTPPVLTPTPTPSEIVTPTPTPTEILTPMPTPTEIPTPSPTPTPATPIPSGYPEPQGINVCRAVFDFNYDTFFFSRDFSTSYEYPGFLSPSYVEGDSIKYFISFQNPANSENSVMFVLPALDVDIYPTNQTTGLAKPSNVLAYKWNDSIGADYSFESSLNTGFIEIKGNQDGYMWGTFEGTLGKVSPYTYLSNGKFVCIP